MIRLGWDFEQSLLSIFKPNGRPAVNIALCASPSELSKQILGPLKKCFSLLAGLSGEYLQPVPSGFELGG